MKGALQRRFVTTAMVAVTALLVCLLGVINVANIVVANRQIRDVLSELTGSEGAYTPPGPPPEPGRDGADAVTQGPNPDRVMGARFFMAFFSPEGQLDRVDVSHIYAVTEETARTIAQEVREQGRASGRYAQFCYALTELDEGGSFLLFLDISAQQASVRTVLLASCLVGAVCWAAMLLLVIALSRRAIAPIARNIERQKQFVTNAGHEIKTPLAIIRTNLDAMELGGGENRWSRNIRAQTDRLTGLMQNLLTLAKLDEAGQALPMQQFSAGLLVEETLDLYREAAEADGIRIAADVQEGLTLRANRESLMQLLSILLDNAVKYSPHGPGEHRVAMSLGQSDRWVRLQVRNDCAEPPEADLERMFDRFYRGDAARTQSGGGYGIGLSAARAILEAHGGSICADYDREAAQMVFTARFPGG